MVELILKVIFNEAVLNSETKALILLIWCVIRGQYRVRLNLDYMIYLHSKLVTGRET